MKAMKKILALLMATLMLACTLAACGSDSGNTDQPANESTPAAATWDGTPQYGGHLNSRCSGRPTGLDPMKQTGAWKYQWTTAVYEPFLTRDNDNVIRPCVCDFELSEDQLDLKVWPREGYTFGRGYGAVEMDDIVASWERGLNQYSSVKKYVAPYVKSAQVETIDGKEVFHIQFSEYSEKCLYYFAAYRTWWPVMPKEICEKYASSYIVGQLEDAVGTGPYIITDFQDSVQVTLTKRDDYTPVDNSQYSGFATTKYGYMDSMTFWYNPTDSSAALAVLAGDYDTTEVIPVDYAQMAEDAGLTLTVLPSDQRTWIFFNTMGTENLVSKYPSLRKAIMAAIDYESFLDVITDSAQDLETDNILLNPRYDTTSVFKSMDYYGAYNQEVVDKYLEAAKAEGYRGEPIQLVHHSGRTDIPTMLVEALENAGINHKLSTMERATYDNFISAPGNNWDLYFAWGVTATTPGLLPDSLVETNYNSERVQQIREQMWTLDPASDEYLALWNEWTQLWAEECQLGYMGAIDWWWWHPKTLHINDDGENGNTARYMFNAYWEDPQNHPKK